jgi:sulfur carrier protein ThiS
MRIPVRLHNRLRTLLPPEAQGRTELVLPEGSTVRDVLETMDIEPRYPAAVNGAIEPDLDRVLVEGDKVAVFAPIGGG